MSEIGEPGEETGSVRNFRFYSRGYLEKLGVKNLGSKLMEDRISRNIYRYNSDVGELWINLTDMGSDRYQIVNILNREAKIDGTGR